MSRELKPVAIFPERIIGANPQDTKAMLYDYAQAVEDLGFEGITAKDHVALGNVPDGNNGYTNQNPFLEPLTLFASLAMITKRIKLCSAVLVLPERQTALVAKQSADIANLSQGRLILGVGVGSNRTEFAAMGANFTDRGKRMAEQIHLLRALWHGEEVTLSDHSIRDEAIEIGINPLPAYPIPVWLGGWATRAVRRAAELGDGWMPMGHPTDIEQALPTFHESLKESHRQLGEFSMMGAFGSTKRGHAQPDTPEALAGILDQWQATGATHVAYGNQQPGVDFSSHVKDLSNFMNVFMESA